MKAYQIKVTILTGPRQGVEYVLTKGGYGASEGAQHIDYCYKTKGKAIAVCKRLAEKNRISHETEAQNRSWTEAKGEKGRDWWIYDLEKYEPIEVECFG